jgi:hypothetical protein
MGQAPVKRYNDKRVDGYTKVLLKPQAAAA